MTLTRSRTRTLLAALLLAPLCWYWIAGTDTAQVEESTASVTSGVDYFLKDVSTREFNAKGELSNQLTADRVDHYPARQGAQLLNPMVTFAPTSEKPSVLQSKTGFVFDDNDRIDLADQVVLTHNPNTAQASQLRTSELTFFRKDGIAKTDAAVELSQQNHVKTATGMITNFNTHTSELLSNVKGTFYVDQ